MKKSIAALAAFLVVFTPNLVMAQATPNAPSTIPRYDNGTNFVPGKTDADGILRITEEYPYQLQNDAFVGASDTTGVAVTTGLKQIGLAWSVSPFGDRVIRIKRKPAGNAIDACYLYLYGSDDNVTFYPLIGSGAWVGAGQAAVDTAKVVPYRMILPSGAGGTASWYFYKLTLPSDIYPGRYLAVFAKRDSTVAGTTQTLSITYEGRWK